MKNWTSLAVAAGLCLCMVSAGVAAPSVYPTGTTLYDPDQAQNGYVLISVDFKDVYANVNNKDAFKDKPDFASPNAVPAAEPSDVVFLMDMNGNVVHSWKDLGDNKKIYLLPDGHLLSISERQSAAIEYDWDGNEVWRYATKLGPHHDGRRLDNGNTLILTYENVPASLIQEKVENVTTPWWGTQDRKSAKLRGDTIIEVNPEGKIVWSWSSSEHLDLNRYMPLTGMNDWTHGNTVSVIPPNKWYDAGDKRFKPGNILYNPRHFDEFLIIDKDSGDVVWSLKDFKALGGLGQAHEPVMIGKGLPGEGNILIFDNGLFTRNGAHAGQSVVWEINPSTNEVVWRYVPAMAGSNRFLSKYKGSAYKMPNGNVLISEDYGGRVFQVKPDANHPDGGEIVWEYMYPSVISRTTLYPYDFTPQLKAMNKPEELKVSPLNPAEWHVLPDAQRKGNAVVKVDEK